MTTQEEKLDLCFLVDTTGSMGEFIESLTPSLEEFIYITELCSIIDTTSILSYKDHCDKEIIQFSGWQEDPKNLLQFIRNLRADGGGDHPEAVKTALYHLVDFVDQKQKEKKTKKTICILFTDAPPHSPFSGSDEKNLSSERDFLGDNFDWMVLTTMVNSADIIVYPIIDHRPGRSPNDKFYPILSQITGGKTLALSNITSTTISHNTVSVFLSTIGYDCTFPQAQFLEVNSLLPEYEDGIPILEISTISDIKSSDFSKLSDQNLVNKFKTDPNYKSVVFQVFEAVVNNFSYITILTTNGLFGALWRAICQERNDPRRQKLLDQMSNVIDSKLSESDEKMMKEFIASSYNRMEIIREKIEACPARYPAFTKVYSSNKNFPETPKDILEIVRSCNKTSFKKMCDMLLTITLVTAPMAANEEDLMGSLPESLPDMDLFGCLPHLFCPGLVFAARQAIVMAMLIVYANIDILYERAIAFLQNHQGMWFRHDNAENFSYEFIKFALRVDKLMTQTMLTPEERILLQTLHTVGGLKSNSESILRIKIPFTSCRTKRPDRKTLCLRCHEYRSFTMLNDDGICGRCLCDEPWPCTDERNSYWCECCLCAVHYAVEDIQALKAKPKCHFCRHEQPVPKVQCTKCLNTFVHCRPRELGNEWVCPPCDMATNPIQDEEVALTLKEYLSTVNGMGFVGPLKQMFQSKSLWSVVEQNAIPERCTLDKLQTFRLKPVKNVPELSSQIEEWIILEKVDQGICMMCFSDLPWRNLRHVCGRTKKCPKCCQDCLNSWYGNVKQGHILTPSNLECPFCKKMPLRKILRRSNRDLCTLNFDPSLADPRWHYAWCMKCSFGKKYIEHACSVDPPIVNDFMCEDCRVDVTIIVKPCPYCAVMTEKKGGCDHITCSNCFKHWCYNCGYLAKDGEDIYNDHLWPVHGNVGLVANREEDNFYEEDNDYY